MGLLMAALATVAIALIGLSAGGVSHVSTPVSWSRASPTELEPHVAGSPLGQNPPFLQRVGLVDDQADGYLLAFGGQNPALEATSYTLTYVNGTWTNLTNAQTALPPPRWGAGMVYDPVDQEVVLFGGCQTAGCYPALADTWTFSGGQWHDITATAGPAPPGRGEGTMTWDSAAGYVLLFGGEAGTGSSTLYLNDTWEFLHNHWTNLSSTVGATAPPARAQAVMASLPSGPVVLFGGAANGPSIPGTWSFLDGNWTDVTSTSGPQPAARTAAMLAVDPAADDLVLFGGYHAGNYLSDTWTYSSGTWIATSASGPPGTFGAGFVYDSEDGYLLLYGGAITQNGQSGTTNSYWSLSGGAWHLYNPAPTPPFDWPVVLLFGGIIALFIGEFAFLSRRQNRRLRELSGLMPEVPPDKIRWIPTQLTPGAARIRRLRPLLMFGIMIPIGLLLTVTILLGAAGQGLLNTLTLLALEWALLIGLPIMILRMASGMETDAVGVSEAGVIVRRRRGDVRIPWEYLQPPNTAPKGPLIFFHFAVPGRAVQANGFGATYDQARAVLTYPSARGWAIPPPVRQALGLDPTPPTIQWPAPIGSQPLPRSVPNTPNPNSGMWPPPSTGRPPFAPSAPPPPPPPPPAFRPAPTASSPSQLRRCPRCGVLASWRVRFCSNCGQPLSPPVR